MDHLGSDKNRSLERSLDRPLEAPDARIACVNVPELPLQLLLRAHPEWALHPAAVVAEDKPHAELLWVNERSRRLGVLPGQRYSTALSLCRELRAGTITPELVAQGVDQLSTALRSFSPHIEPSTHEPGVFWIDASGLSLLYASLATWARSIERALTEAAWSVVIAVGFSRFFTYALAKSATSSARSVLCFAAREVEQNAAFTVPLSRLGVPPRARETLSKLGVHTVGAFLQLPASGLLERFGPEIHALHQLASGQRWAPLQPVAEVVPLVVRHLFDDEERDVNRLLFILKRGLDTLLHTLASRQQALESLSITCLLDGAAPYQQTIKPAEPTLDIRQILDLVRLRLEAMPLPAPVTELEVVVTGLLATAEQLRLLSESVRRDLAAADRALARIRAELGPDAVTHAVLQDAHLPEASVRFQRLEHVRFPQPVARAQRIAIRRLWSKPTEAAFHHTALDHAARIGPFVIRGGWWSRQVTRQYYFVETDNGELLYCFYDAERGRFMLHGAL